MAELSRTEKKKKRHRKGRGQKVVIWSFFILAILVFSVAVIINNQFNDFIDDITTLPDEEPVIVGIEPIDPKYTEDAFAMVVIGMDTREQTGGLNTDVLIVAVVEPETQNVTMLSIPRDTAVAMPGYKGYEKVNAVYAAGDNARRKAERNNEAVTVTGSSLLKKTIEGLLGIPVKHYVTIDFQGFVKVIDELGGIEVDVERKLIYTDPTDGTNINLEKGLQTLSGKQALDYVRHRMDDRGTKYYSTDYDRNRRQQLVIKKIVDKMKSISGVTKIPSVMKTAGNHIRTDLSEEKIKGLAKDFVTVGSENITILQTGADWNSKIAKTVIPNDKLEEIRKDLWSKMGMAEKEGRALLLKENDRVVEVLTEAADKAAREAEKKAAEQALEQEKNITEVIEDNSVDTIPVNNDAQSPDAIGTDSSETNNTGQKVSP